MSSPNPLEQPCPDCGEMVRVNSVRCWNCGAFMNQELALKYQQMQANPGPIILSEIPDGDLHSVAEDSDDEGYELSIPKPATAQPVADTTSTETGSATAPAPTSEASPASGSGEAKSGEESSVAHSVATGGDALLDIARQEEAEIRKKRKGRKVAGVRTAGGGFVIFCPYGCK
ncbi:MAG: hypothetical protein KDA58_14070, partial [Planctomycetaceae bacterium]|nr:hypothetical protein [Planctomycetaceae bacterium]